MLVFTRDVARPTEDEVQRVDATEWQQQRTDELPTAALVGEGATARADLDALHGSELLVAHFERHRPVAAPHAIIAQHSRARLMYDSMQAAVDQRKCQHDAVGRKGDGLQQHFDGQLRPARRSLLAAR